MQITFGSETADGSRPVLVDGITKGIARLVNGRWEILIGGHWSFTVDELEDFQSQFDKWQDGEI